MTADPDLVVVGSGFGGAVVAMRAAEAGLRVLVLERGREYGPEAFPRDPRRVQDVLWRRGRRSSDGLYDVRLLSGLGVVSAAGVGGGSLVFAGVLVQPEPEVFAGWPQEVRDGLEQGFDAVREVLRPTPLPADVPVPKRDLLVRAARRLGRPAHDPPLAIGWDAGSAPGGVGCALDAACELGCSVGAKRSLDVTYLARARRAGAQVLAQAEVVSLARDGAGGYLVHHRVRDQGATRTRTVRAPRVVLSAGTLGTCELLLTSRDRTRTLPGPSSRLGHGVSANGDFVATLWGSAEPVRPGRGPDVTTVVRSLPGEPAFTVAAPTSTAAAMRVVASWGRRSGRWLRPLAPLLWPRLGGLLSLALRTGALSRPLPWPLGSAGDPERMTFLFAMGRDDAGGRAVLRRGRLDVRWRYAAANAALVGAVQQAVTDLGRAYGGTAQPLVTWSAFRRPVSFHPLGGCALSESPATGVVGPTGEVHGCPGLFVADASLVPGALGVHPAMTVAALAEHVARRGVLGDVRQVVRAAGDRRGDRVEGQS